MMEDETFKSIYVGQLMEAKNKIFETMCNDTGVTYNDELRLATLDTRRVTKTTLAEWLETVCRILDAFATPVLNSAVAMESELGTLKNERIADQKKIIELQEKIIEKKDLELDTVKNEMKTTVQSETKSYSSVLKTTCSQALAPRRVQAALKTAAAEEDRSKSLIIYGVEEKEEEKLEETVLDILAHLDEKPRIVSCCRLGKNNVEGEGVTKKPIRVNLSGTDHVRQILQKKRKLRSVEGCTTVYLSPDKSTEQRVNHKKLVDEMKKKRLSEPDKHHFIRNNLVVSVSSGT